MKIGIDLVLPKGDTARQFPQIFVIIASLLAPFTCGMNASWISPSHFLNQTVSRELSFEEASYLPVASSISLALTAFPMSYLVDRIGRKNLIILISIPQFCSWMIIAFVNSNYILYLAKVLVGVSDAALFASLPIYIGEIAEPSIRGSWGNLTGFAIYFGTFMVNVIGFHKNVMKKAVICSCFPILHALLFSLAPESPYYLLMKKKPEEAKKALETLRWSKNIDKEFDQIKADVERQISEENTYKELFILPVHRRALLICLFVRGAQQLSGLSIFGSYTFHMFQKSENRFSPYGYTLIFVLFFALTVLFSLLLVDKFGRRPLILFSCIGCGLIYLILAASYYMKDMMHVENEFLEWVPLIASICYIFTCASGIGVLPITLLSEVFSASIKSKGVLVNSVCHAGWVVLAAKLFHSFTSHFGLMISFASFAVCCFASALISYHIVLETKGKTLEQVQQHIRRKTMFIQPTFVEMTRL